MKKLLYSLLPLTVVLVLNGCSSNDPIVPPSFNNMDDIAAGAYEEVTLHVANYADRYQVTINGWTIDEVKASSNGSEYTLTFQIPFQAESGNIRIHADNGAIIEGPKFTYIPRYFQAFVHGQKRVGRALTGYAGGMLSWDQNERTFYTMNTKSVETSGASLNLAVSYTKRAIALPDQSKSTGLYKLTGIAVTDYNDVLFYNAYTAANSLDISNQFMVSDFDRPDASYATNGLPSSGLGIIIDIETDGDGENTFFVEEGENYIRKLIAYDNVATLAGSTPGHADGQGTAARFDRITDMTYDRTRKNLYVADSNCIRLVTPAGTVTTFAGSTTSGDKNGSLADARFKDIKGLYFSDDGKLYIADAGNQKIKVIDENRTTVTTLNGAHATNSDAGNMHLVVDIGGIIYTLSDGTNNILEAYIPESFMTEAQFKIFLDMEKNGETADIVLAEGQ